MFGMSFFLTDEAAQLFVGAVIIYAKVMDLLLIVIIFGAV
jgi:hypothetical protein